MSPVPTGFSTHPSTHIHTHPRRALVAAGALLPLVTHLNVRDAHHPYHPTAPRGGHDTSAASGQQQSCEASLQALCTMSADVQVAARLLQVEGVLDAVMQLVGHAEVWGVCGGGRMQMSMVCGGGWDADDASVVWTHSWCVT